MDSGAWSWQDFQFYYEVLIDRDNFHYLKKLRHGGYLPTGPISLTGSLIRKVAGKPQPGEDLVTLPLFDVASIALQKRPYRGYSAFRKPVVIFSGILVAGAVMLNFPPQGAWTGWDYARLAGSALIPCFLVDWALARLFPHRALLLTTYSSKLYEVDVHTLPEPTRNEVLEQLRQAVAQVNGPGR